MVFVNSLHSTRQFNQLAVTTHAWVIVFCSVGSVMLYSKAHSPILYYDTRVPRSPAIVRIHDLRRSFVSSSCTCVQLPDDTVSITSYSGMISTHVDLESIV